MDGYITYIHMTDKSELTLYKQLVALKRAVVVKTIAKCLTIARLHLQKCRWYGQFLRILPRHLWEGRGL